MTIETNEIANKELSEASSITQILESAHGQEALNSPGFLDSMREQAKHLGETLPEKYQVKDANPK